MCDNEYIDAAEYIENGKTNLFCLFSKGKNAYPFPNLHIEMIGNMDLGFYDGGPANQRISVEGKIVYVRE